MILFGISVVFPLFETIRLSFFDIKGLGKPKYVGFGNYIRLFADPAFRNTLSTTLIFTLGDHGDVGQHRLAAGHAVLVCAARRRRRSAS